MMANRVAMGNYLDPAFPLGVFRRLFLFPLENSELTARNITRVSMFHAGEEAEAKLSQAE